MRALIPLLCLCLLVLASTCVNLVNAETQPASDLSISTLQQRREISLDFKPLSYYIRKISQDTDTFQFSWNPSPEWPERYEDLNGWLFYAEYLAIVLIVPIIFGLIATTILMFIWCCRKCGCCGGSAGNADGYRAKDRKRISIGFFITVVMMGAACVGGIVFCVIFADGFRGAIGQADTLVGDVKSLWTTGQSRVHGIINTVDDTLNTVEDLISQTSTLQGPLHALTGVISGVSDSLTDATNAMSRADVSVAQIRQHVDSLNEIAQRNSVDNVPQSSAIPDVSQSIQQVTNVNQALQGLEDEITNIHQTVNNTLDNVGQEAQSAIDNARNQVDSITQPIISNINTLDEMIGPVLNQSDEYIGYVYLGEDIRFGVTVGFFALIVLIYIFGIIGFCCAKRICAKLLACFNFSVMFWFFVLFAVQFVLFTGIRDTCERHDPFLRMNIPRLINNPSFNSTHVFALLECSGNTTVLDVMGFDVSGLNASGIIDEYIDTFQSAIAAFDVDAIAQDANNRIDSFAVEGLNVTVDYSQSISNLQANMSSLVAQTNDFSRFNFEIDTFTGLIDEINSLTRQITPLPDPVWAPSNISQLDMNMPPYLTAPEPQRQQIETRADAAKLMVAEYNRALRDMSDARNNATAIIALLDYVNGNLTETKNDIDSALTQPQNMKNIVGSLHGVASTYLANVSSVITSFRTIGDSVEGLFSLARCAPIGTFYSGTVNHICETANPTLQGTAVCCLLIGLVMFIMYPVLLVASKRLGNKRSLVVGDIKNVA